MFLSFIREKYRDILVQPDKHEKDLNYLKNTGIRVIYYVQLKGNYPVSGFIFPTWHEHKRTLAPGWWGTNR